MFVLMHFLDCFLGTMQIIVIIAIYLPILLLPFVPIVFFTWWVAYQYLKVSRELKRLESLKKSPVFVLFSETLQGLSIIRAFRQEQRFFKDCCNRIDEMNRCHLYLWLCNRWLHIRMQMLGAVVAGAVGLAVVLEADAIGSTAAGILIIYSMNFSDNLTFLTRSHAEVFMLFNYYNMNKICLV
jgi:ABC-type bacteriocin/lantibiotic exporter with double-glycine peptidase domain